MKALFIFSYHDLPIMQKIDRAVREVPDFDAVWLKKKTRFWRVQFGWRLLWSSVVVLLENGRAGQSKNIGWELRWAKRLRKRVHVLSVPQDDGKYDKQAVERLLQKREPEMRALYNQKSILDVLQHTGMKKLFFEEYKLMVQTSEALVERRQKVNNFFLTAQGAILSVAGVLAKDIKQLSDVAKFPEWFLLIFLFLIGVAFAWSWRSQIRSFGQLNAGKFCVINEMERHLPAAVFQAEWQALGEGKDSSKYTSFTKAESLVPCAFLVGYLLMIVLLTVIGCIYGGIEWKSLLGWWIS